MRLLLVMLILVASVLPSLGDEKPENPFRSEDARKAFEQALKSGMIPTDAELDQERKFFQEATRRPKSLVGIIRRYDLYYELEISAAQRGQLDSLSWPNPANITAAMGRTVRKVPPAEYKAFVNDYHRVANQLHTLSNDAVEDILTKKQMKRLRQIAFQVDTVEYIVPESAMGYYAHELDQRMMNQLRKQLAQVRSAARIGQRFIEFDEAYKILVEWAGHAKVRRLLGEPHWGFMGSVDVVRDYPVLATELGITEKGEAKKAVNNPRRNRDQ